MAEIKIDSIQVQDQQVLSNFSGLVYDRPAQSWVDLLVRLQMDDIGHNGVVVFVRKHWLISVYASALYLIFLVTGLQWMKKRTPFDLRLPLAFWSGALCIFSILGTIATWPEFISLWKKTGFVSTYCDNSYREDSRIMYWYTVFVLSKLIELGDTVFIVLRKQKLITLHWVHHVLTLVYCFHVYRDQVSTARWMVSMNFLVHSLMYGYYALKALRYRIPRSVAKLITNGQIVQMIFGFWINIHILAMKMTGTDNGCQCSLRASVSGFLLYGLFFYYFVKFFIDTYVKKGKRSKTLKNVEFKIDDNSNHLDSQSLSEKKER